MEETKKMDHIKTLLVGIFTGLTAFLHPISGDVYSLLLVFVVNFLCGLIAAYCKGEDFDFKKAFRCVIEAAMFFVLIASIFAVGKFKGNASGALQCVSFVVYAVTYFYSVNVLRNLQNIFKQGTAAHSAVKFLYHILSVEFVKKIPYLSAYINQTIPETDGSAD